MKVVTFGEIMLRLSPHGYHRFTQSDSFEATYGGGEANVAVSLSNYGIDAVFVSKVPEHAIGQAAVNDLRRYGVDTSKIVRGGERLGIYFLEKGASQRASQVIYDRAHSSIATAKESDFNWEEIFDGVDWFHFTGITPALNDDVAAICLTAVKKARELGVQVSCDLNYRNKLWSKEKANEVMSTLMPYVDLVVANEEDAYDTFGIKAGNTDVTSGELEHDSYIDVARQLNEKFGCKYISITLRESISASVNNWAGMLYVDNKAYFSPTYQINIVDRVGGGDSFGGGLIYSVLSGKSPQDAINFAVAASCLKHTVQGDYNRVSIQEVETLAGGDGSGRVQR
ncbi:MAG TPA: sugar kinase [Erysipelotrichaceae bacterium]|nr:sugar kinase [Erysipelotrichaceae bacterium]